MYLIDEILSGTNISLAMDAVMENNGAPGVDDMDAYELPDWWLMHGQQTCKEIQEMKYKPLPVRRVYIPKPNGKKRPLGIPAVKDRLIQQAAAQILDGIFDPLFSDSSFGFRLGRSAHDAVFQALEYLNEGYTWIVDLDIEKFFDRVNHDKLISIIRTQMNDKVTLHLIRSFLKAGVMEEGNVSRSDIGTLQGGCISPLLANIYLDQFDKELEKRGLRFCRYADDVVIFTKSELAANRVMKSVSTWLEKKLFLKTSPTKTHVCRPSKSQFLGFTFWYSKGKWHAVPAQDRRKRLCDKIREVLCRKRAAGRSLAAVFTKVNQIVRGWINYFAIGPMKTFMTRFGEWLRHKIRVIILKQWKRPKTICENLTKLSHLLPQEFDPELIRQTANSRLGLYQTAGWSTVNFLISPKVLATPKGDRPGLVDPLQYYYSKVRT